MLLVMTKVPALWMPSPPSKRRRLPVIWLAVMVLVLILAQCLVWPVCRKQFWPSQTDTIQQQAKSLEDRLNSIEERLGSLVEMLVDQSTQQEQVIDICERVERRLCQSGPSEEDGDTDED